MAYPYYPAYTNPYQQSFYQPIYQPMQTAQQPQMVTQPVQPQSTAQSFSPAINQSGIIWIGGEAEASMYPIAPNNAVALWEKSGKTIYLKQADATGKPTMTVYDLVERSQSASDGVSETGGKSIDFATKDELSAVVGAVKSFDDVLVSLKADVDAIKGDMYGIAGKKKSSGKKVVEVDDDE